MPSVIRLVMAAENPADGARRLPGDSFELESPTAAVRYRE